MKILTALCVLAISATAHAAFPTNTTTASFTTTNVTDYKDYSWKWSALDAQKIDATFDTDISGNTLSFRLARQKTGDTDLEVTGFNVVTSNGVVAFSGTNLPANGLYYSEFMIYPTNSSTTIYRSLAKGKVQIINSLFQATNTQASGVTVVAPSYPDYIKVQDPDGTVGDVWWFNGTVWYRLNIGTAGQVVGTDDGTSVKWVSSGGGTTYTAGTNIDLAGTVFNLDGAAQASDDLADTSLQPGDTNGWIVSSHATFGTGDVSQVYVDQQDEAYSNGVIVQIGGSNYVTQAGLDTSTNAAVIDATQRVANVGYLTAEVDPIWSGVSNLYDTTAEIDAKTNALDGIVIARNYLTAEADTFATVAARGNSYASYLVLGNATDTGSGGAIRAHVSCGIAAYIESDGDDALYVYAAGSNTIYATAGTVGGFAFRTPNKIQALQGFYGPATGLTAIPAAQLTGDIAALRMTAAVTNLEPNSITSAMLQDKSVTGDKIGSTNNATTGYIIKATVAAGVTNLYFTSEAAGGTDTQRGAGLGLVVTSTNLAMNITNSWTSGYILKTVNAGTSFYWTVEASGGVDLDSATGTGSTAFSNAVTLASSITNTLAYVLDRTKHTGNAPVAALTNACDPRYVNTNEAGSVTGLMLSLTNVPVVDYIVAFDADSNLYAKADAAGGIDLDASTGDGNLNFTNAVQAAQTAGGGSGTNTIAEVLAQGNDANDLAITNLASSSASASNSYAATTEYVMDTAAAESWGSGGSSIWTDNGDGTTTYNATNTSSPSVTIVGGVMAANAKQFSVTNENNGEIFFIDEDGDVWVTRIVSIQDNGTSISLANKNLITFTVYNEQMLSLANLAQDYIKIGDGGDMDFRVSVAGNEYALAVNGSTGNVSINGDPLNGALAKLHVYGAAAFESYTNTPTAYTNVAQFFATNAASAEMWVMDGAGNATQLSSHNGNRRQIANSYNVWTGEGKTVDLWALAEAVEALTGQTNIVTDYSVTRRDWGKVEAKKVAKRDASISAWMSDTNAVDIKGEKPTTIIAAKKPQWLTDWDNGNATEATK